MSIPLTTINISYLNYLRSLENQWNDILAQTKEIQYNLEKERKANKELREQINKLRNEAMIWVPRPWELERCNHLPTNVVKIAHNIFKIPWSILIDVKLSSDYKTMMCTNKYCKKGYKCNKAHSDRELKFFKKHLSK